VHGATPRLGVNQDDALPLLRQRDGEVHRRGRLAVARQALVRTMTRGARGGVR